MVKIFVSNLCHPGSPCKHQVNIYDDNGGCKIDILPSTMIEKLLKEKNPHIEDSVKKYRKQQQQRRGTGVKLICLLGNRHVESYPCRCSVKLVYENEKTERVRLMSCDKIYQLHLNNSESTFEDNDLLEHTRLVWEYVKNF